MPNEDEGGFYETNPAACATAVLTAATLEELLLGSRSNNTEEESPINYRYSHRLYSSILLFLLENNHNISFTLDVGRTQDNSYYIRFCSLQLELYLVFSDRPHNKEAAMLIANMFGKSNDGIVYNIG